MVQIKNKLLQEGKGAIAGMVIYTVQGKTYARSLPDQYNDRKSTAQLAQRRRMVLVMDFLKPFKELLRFTFPGEPGKRCGYFAAKSYNLRNGLKGEYPGIQINKQTALLCHGPVPVPIQMEVVRLGDALLFEWDTILSDSAGAPDDTLVVMARQVLSHASDYQFTGVKRQTGRYLWQPDLPVDGGEAKVWVAFRRSDQVVMSDSCFLGER